MQIDFGQALDAERAVERALRSIRVSMPYGVHPDETALTVALQVLAEARHATGGLVDAERDGRLEEAVPAILRRWAEVIHIEGGKK